MQANDINAAIGKKMMIVSLQRFAVMQRAAMYVRGLLPGRSIQLLQVSPMGDPLIIAVGEQKLAISRETWMQLELQESTV